MRYPQTFIERVEAVYPNHEDIKTALQAGNARYLARALDEFRTGFSAGQIVQALESGKSDELLAAAKRRIEQDKIWGEFVNLQERSEGRRASL